VSAAGRLLSAGEIAALVGGRLVGAADVTVSRVASLERSQPGDLSFLATARYLQYFQQTRATVVLVKPEFADAPSSATRIVVTHPQRALLTVIPVLHPEPPWTPGIHPTAVVGAGARWDEPVALGAHVVLGRDVRLGRNVRIGAGCIIGDGVTIGDDTQLFPQVVCYPGTIVGRRVILHAGVRLGSDGFGYLRDGRADGHQKIPHVGRCIIEDDVEIGANTAIDRPAVGETRVRAGTKIDNLVQIGHGVTVGRRVLLASQVGIAGSAVIEDDVVMGGQVGVGGHLRVGRRAIAAGKTVITKSVPPGAFLTGYPGIPNREWRKSSVIFRRLPELKKRVEELERLVAELARADRTRRRSSRPRRR
jgi:UDP-3-O-[3-hydroxymyristoyl] glucosamine N-acyltransferase